MTDPAMEVLLVGDTLSTDVVAEGMRSVGLSNIIEAGDNESAVAQLDAHRPDLIIVEERTPNLDGMSFVQHVRTSAEYKHLPVILIVPRLTHSVKMAGRGLQVNGYLHGLFTKEDVPKLINDIFPEFL